MTYGTSAESMRETMPSPFIQRYIDVRCTTAHARYESLHRTKLIRCYPVYYSTLEEGVRVG